MKTFSEDGFLEQVRSWLDAGGDPNVIVNESGWSLLHLAAEYAEVGAIDLLVQRGADIDVRDETGATPLHIAVDIDIDGAHQANSALTFRVTTALLNLGATAESRDHQGRTPEDWIAGYGQEVISRFRSLVA